MKELTLTSKQFNILTILAEAGIPLTQRELADISGYALGSINQIMKAFTEDGNVNYGAITRTGYALLEPFRVERAIILADDFKPRMMPLSLKTPVAMIKIQEQRIIDRLLDAIINAGIEEIYIVCGHLKEQFNQLLQKYPNITLVENSFFNKANSISSLMCVRHLLKNVYICEADLLLKDPKQIKRYQYSSNFLGHPVERTDSWCFDVTRKIILSQKIGGEIVVNEYNRKTPRLYQKIGISYWTEVDGMRLAEHMEQIYKMPGGKERYWEQIPLEFFKNQYKVKIRECQANDIMKIDSIEKVKLAGRLR